MADKRIEVNINIDGFFAGCLLGMFVAMLITQIM